MNTLHLRLFIVAAVALVALTALSRQFPDAAIAVREGGWLLLGVYGTLLGFRFVRPAAGVNPQYDNVYEKSTKWLKLLGPLCIAKGVAFFAFDLRIPYDLIQR